MSSDEGPPALSISRLSKHYGATTALADVALSVRAGELHALIGTNGSGKSTLVKVVAGVVRGDAGGTVDAGGIRVASDRVTPEWSRHVGLRFVHQDLALVPDLSVAENIALASGFQTTRIGAIDRRALRTNAAELLDRFRIDVTPECLVRDLGPADRAMVAIARALEGDRTNGHHTLVLDEALAALPAPDAARVIDRLRDTADRGGAVVIVSHRIPQLLEVADVVTVLRGGQRRGNPRRQRARPTLRRRADGWTRTLAAGRRDRVPFVGRPAGARARAPRRGTRP